MTKGVIYKCSGTAWTKSQVKDTATNSEAWDDGLVKHWDVVNNMWQLNYPMVQVYEQYFNITWSQAYNGSGVQLDIGTWGDHPRAGDTIGFMGFFGFDNAALKSFVGSGVVKGIQIEVMFDDPSHSGHPDIKFAAHTYTSKPTSASWSAIKTAYYTQSKFYQTGADFKRWITLPVTAWSGGTMAGVAVFGAENTAANSARFAGKTTSHSLNSFNTRLFLQVEK